MATKTLQDLDGALEAMADVKALKRGVVRIAAPQLMSCAVLPEVIASFNREHPNIDVRLLDCLVESVLGKVHSGEVDFGIGPERESSADIEAQTLFELPFVVGEPYAGMVPDDTGAALQYLADHGVVHAGGERFHWAADAYPANHVSLRSVGWDNFVIIDLDTDKTIAEMDWRSTHTMLHEQAIYQHDGEQYQVELLDHENHKAYVKKVVPDYFTTAMTNRKITVMEVDKESALAGGRSGIRRLLQFALALEVFLASPAATGTSALTER